MIIFPVLLLFLTIIVAIAVVTKSPTKGKKIDVYQNPRTAVMVIDMQEDVTGVDATSPFPIANSSLLVENINKLIDKAKAKDWVIIYIKQELPKRLSFLTRGKTIKGTSGAEIDRRIKIESQNIFSKEYSDAFWNPGLSDLLIKNHVNEIYVAGIAADECVRATAFGAVNRGYKVKAVKEAIGMIEPFKLQNTLEGYVKKGIDVVSVSQIRQSAHSRG